MAEENKLIYYVEINTEKGIKDALERLEGFNKKAQATLKGITGKSSANAEVEGLKKQLDELSKAWNDYNIAQRKGAPGNETLSAFRDINNEAGIYAGNIRQVVKAQNEQSESATVVYKMLQALRKEFRGLGEEQLKDPKVLQEYVNRFNEIKSISEAAGLSIDQYVGKLKKQSTEEEKLAIKQEELAKKMATVIGQRDALNKKFRDMTPELQMGTAGQNVLSQMAELNTQYGHLFKSASQIVQEQDKLNASKQKEIEFLNTTEGKYAKLEALWKDLAASQKSGKQGSQLVAQMEALDAVYKETDMSLRKYTDTIVRSREEEEKKSAILSTYAGQVGALSDAWNKLTIAERKGKEGQELITQFDKLKNDAGIYAGSLEQVATSQRKLATGTAAANKQFSLQSKILMQLKAQMGMYLSTYALIRFAKSVRDITGEFELQRVSLAAILQDKAEADKIFGQIVELALQSPFRIKDITSYTKQLAAYRVETDKLFDTTKRLADISAGLGVDMDRLVLAYGQVKAASVLRGQELRQFTEAGIPLIQLLADKFTKLNGEMVSTGEVFSLISQRAVPFRMIEEIFNDMTDAGGVFYNMQKIQAQTIKGVWANLADAYDKMYYEIGQKNMGLLKGLGNFLRGLADNWEKVYNGLSAVTAGYVAYLVVSKLVLASTKVLTAAQLSNIAADGKAVFTRLSLTHTTAYATKVSNAYMAAQYKLAASTNFLSKAFYKLWSAILLNPIAAAVAAAIALTVVIGGAIIRANSLNSTIKRLSESTTEYKKLTEEVEPALEIYKKLNIVGIKSEKQMNDMANAVEILAGKYPTAVKEVDEYGKAVKIAADEVERLYKAELELQKITLKSDLDKLKEKRDVLEAQKAAIDNVIAIRQEQGTIKGPLGEAWARGMLKDLKKVTDNLSEVNVKIKETEEALGMDTGAGVAVDALAGMQKYVFELQAAFKHPVTGKEIKLYDAEEDIQAFSSDIELLDDIAKKYKEASEQAAFYAKNKNNPDITKSERENYENLGKVAEAERQLVLQVLKRYNATNLIDKTTKAESKSAVDKLQDEITTAKDARAAYEGYLKVMNEVRAKQTVEDQLKFAGIKFDVADSGSYKQYLHDVYNRIKNDPNYEKVRTLIEDALVDFDLKSIETELKNKLEKISNDIAKTQKANDFFEKILGLTGDIELSKKLTIKYTGTAAGDTAKEIRDGLQEALRVAFDDESIDIANMTLEQIQEKIDTIPDAMSEKKSKVQEFFYAFIENGQDAAIKTAELADELDKLKMDDFALFGTGAGLDISKAIAELRKNIKTISKEQVEKENELSRLRSENGDEWYEKEMRAWSDVFATRRQNEKTIAEEKLKDIASALFAEQKTAYGLDFLLNDIGDKSMRQINEAMKRIEEMSKVKVLNIPESAINALALYGYEIDNIAESELDGIFEKTGDLISEEEQRLIRLVVAMKALGISTQELDKAYAELVEQQKKDTSEEKQKKTRDAVINTAKEVLKLSDTIGEMAKAMGDENIADFTATISSIADVVQSIASGAKSGSWIGAIVGAATSLASIIADDITKTSELKKSVAESNLDAWVKSVEKLTSRESVFGNTFFIGVRNNINAASESLRKYNQILGEAVQTMSKVGTDTVYKTVPIVSATFGQTPSFFAYINEKIFGKNIDVNAQKDAYVEAYKKAIEEGYNEIESFIIRINNRSAFANFFGWQDKYSSLKDVVEQLGYELYGSDGILNTEALQAALTTYGEEMSDAQRRWVEEAIAATEEYKEAMDALDSYVSQIFGNLASDIASLMIDSFKEIGFSAYGLMDVFSDLSESIINSLLQTMLIDTVLDKYKEKIKGILGDTSKTDQERANELVGIVTDMRADVLAFAAGKDAFLQAAKESGLLTMADTGGTDGLSADEWKKALEEIDKIIAASTEKASTYNEELLDRLRKELDEIVNSIGITEQRLGESMTELLSSEPEKGTKAWDIWKQELDELNDKFLSVGISYEEYLAKQERYKELLNQIAEMEDNYASSVSIELMLKQRKEILDKIYDSGYDKYATDEMKQEDTLKEYLSDMDLYNKLANEATDPAQQEKWRKLAALAKAAFDGAVLENFNTKLDESLSGIDDNYEKMSFLQKMLSSLTDQAQIDEVTKQIKELKETIFSDLYSTYADDTQKYVDELADIQKHLQWAIENGYPELAEWIRKAYDTKVLDKWKEGLDEIAGKIENDYERYAFLQEQLRKYAAIMFMAKFTGNTKAGEDAYKQYQYISDLLKELQGSIEENLFSDYATDAQKYEQELVDMNKDLEWAIRNYPDLADEISDAFNTSVLKNWQDAWDDAFEHFDTSFQKWQAIQQELGNLGTPNITKDEAIKGRDSALVEMGKYKEGTAEYAAAKAAYDYYQAQLLLHMKINELLIQQADIEDELYDKYRSGEQEYADDIAEREADIKTLEGIRDQFAPDTKEWEKWNDVVKNAQKELRKFVSDYNLDGLTEEFNSTFGDITGLSTKKVKEMLEAFREQILSSDLSDDAKKEAFALIDDIYEQLDERTQEAFENIESAVNSLGSLLESFGADENIINSFKGIETAIGGVAQIVTGVVSGNWFTVLAGIAKLISGFINAIKSLITFFNGDPLAGLEAIATTVTNAQNAVEKAIGTAKSQEQAKLLATYAQAIAQINEAISSESGKKDTWWTRLWGTAPDADAIEKLKEQREEYEKLMEEVQESMKSDFLQTDYTSFSDALADILIKPWDSYMEMMEAVKELTDNTINEIVKHALSLQLQQQVNAALESLYKRGISDTSLDQFDRDIESIVAGYAAYQEALGKYFTGDVGTSTAYDTISRITEAQANSFLGYYQNYLIIMTDMSNVLKRIFDSMSKISVNVNLDGYLNTLQAIATNTALTARNTAFIEGMAADIKTLKNSMTRSGAY